MAGIHEPPGFARVRAHDGRLSVPSIVTVVEQLRAGIREMPSRPHESLLQQLDEETDTTLLFLEAIDLLESIEQTEGTGTAPISIPKWPEDAPEAAQNYPILSYTDFIAGRRPRSQAQLPHNSLGGSDVSIVRTALNRIIGHGFNELPGDGTHDDDSVHDDIFDMADETADAIEALNAGEEFHSKRMSGRQETQGQAARRQIERARKASKDEIIFAAAEFDERIRTRNKAGTLDNRDMIRLRALLMVICTSGLPPGPKSPRFRRSRYQVLPAEGDNDAWPLVIGRALFGLFGGPKPAILHFYLSSEHDQIPDDILECWATCYWCLQACLTAPLSPAEHARITHRFAPLAELAYRLTLPTKAELLDKDVLKIMDRMSAMFCNRLGVNLEVIAESHSKTVDALFTNRC